MFCKICSQILRVSSRTDTIVIHFSRFYQTHYEVLNLRRDCSAKDIKDAFIKLSKEHHPDVNKNKQSHGRFLQINEAYKVLGKVESRRDYDLGLASFGKYPHISRQRQAYYDTRSRNPYDDPLFYVNRDRTRDKFYQNQPYYGIDGIPRLSNGAIVFFCLFFALVGVGLQCVAISHSHTFQRDALIKRSLETQNILNQSRQAAANNGNSAQLEALKTKLLVNTDNK